MNARPRPIKRQMPIKLKSVIGSDVTAKFDHSQAMSNTSFGFTSPGPPWHREVIRGCMPSATFALYESS